MRSLLGGLLLLLSACSTTSGMHVKGRSYLAWGKRQAQLLQLDEWRVTSSLGIEHDDDYTVASFDWLQYENASYTIYVYSPLDLNKIRLTGQPGEVTLYKSSTEHDSAETPERLMQYELGWSLPVSNLKYWIRGVPAPGVKAATVFDSYNHLAKLKQQGWHVRYARFVKIDGVDLPSKITLWRGKIKAALAIKDWELGEFAVDDE